MPAVFWISNKDSAIPQIYTVEGKYAFTNGRFKQRTMSLFETLSDMSRQHAENSGDVGQYKYTEPMSPWDKLSEEDRAEQDEKARQRWSESVKEPAPTVSLYNLLDHSYDQLFLLWTAVKIMEAEVRPYKLTRADTYSDLCAWALLLDTAMKEKKDRDSEAWATHTAREIVNGTI